MSEALAKQLPVIVECNAWTLPQERYNATWIVEKQVGVVLHSFAGIDQAVAELIEPSNLARYRANAAALDNRAIFEIPGYPRENLRAVAGGTAPAIRRSPCWSAKSRLE